MASSVRTVIDLFSGCGGMSWGFRCYPRRYKIVAAVDLEKGKPGNGKSRGTRLHCNPTYARNIGVTPFHENIADLSPSALRRRTGLKKGELGVLISCAPCTGFSQKKARNHLVDDQQNLLVERSALFVREFQPTCFVMENVKELLRGKQEHHFLALSKELGAMGYVIDARAHNLADFGLPQSRTRVLVIAWKNGEPPVLEPLLERRTVRDAIADLPAIQAGQTHSDDPMHTCPNHTSHTIDRMRAIPHDGGSWSDIPPSQKHLLIPSMSRRRSGSFPDIYGRMWWDRPAITVTRECAHPGNGRYTHPEQDRMLSVREMALLQGFPKDYYFDGPLTAKYNQIGDAVPPSFSKIVADAIWQASRGKAKTRRQVDLPLFA